MLPRQDSRKHSLPFNLVLLSILVFIGVSLSYFSFYSTKKSTIGPTWATGSEPHTENPLCQSVLTEINLTRAQAHIAPIRPEKTLTRAAAAKLEDMLEHDYFAHINPQTHKKWSDFIRDSGYQYHEIGENLAIGYTSATEIVQAWLDSPTHRKNLLTAEFTDSGMACRYIATKQQENQEFMIIVHFLGQPAR